jgi:hypothetical protein
MREADECRAQNGEQALCVLCSTLSAYSFSYCVGVGVAGPVLVGSTWMMPVMPGWIEQ